ncbi:unnamed protein product, partial [Allacma fusca]
MERLLHGTRQYFGIFIVTLVLVYSISYYVSKTEPKIWYNFLHTRIFDLIKSNHMSRCDSTNTTAKVPDGKEMLMLHKNFDLGIIKLPDVQEGHDYLWGKTNHSSNVSHFFGCPYRDIWRTGNNLYNS